MDSNTNGSDVNMQGQKLNLCDNEDIGGKKGFVDDKALRIMKLMGYKSGSGLGKNEQGPKNPIAVKHQCNTQGLGLIEKIPWQFSDEEISVEEKVDWIESSDDFPFNYESMKEWMKESQPLTKIDDQYEYCDKEVLRGVIKGKEIFDELGVKDLFKARVRANPFETIRKMFFLNRAALKIANIDAATDFMFTNIDQNIHHKNWSPPYYFADVCAGPGGFTEYILWRKQWFFKGFGFTLRDGIHDFKLDTSICASRINFQTFYGFHKDGDVCCPENIDDFKEKVLVETEGSGVHFMMSDGGFSVEGNENIQEVLSKNIYICQCLVCLEIVKNNGHFVTKFYDVFTPFSVGLIYLMYKCFEKVCILKPNSSRPANSERYLICYGLRNSKYIQDIKQYLRQVVRKLWAIKDDNSLDISDIVPTEIIKKDDKFYSYMYNSNNKIGRKQIINLRKLEAFCRNPNLIENRQQELRSNCLKYWKIPDISKTRSNIPWTVEELQATIDKRELLLAQPRECFDYNNLRYTVRDLADWHYAPMQSSKNKNLCRFYAGVSLATVYKLKSDKWEKANKITLHRGTVLYGELVTETYTQTNNTESLTSSLHVIDALRLGDFDISNMEFKERMKWIHIYCKAVNQETRKRLIRIRPKSINSLELLSQSSIFNENGNYYSTLQPIMGLNALKEAFNVNSILLLKTNESHNFYSTYILRVLVFLKQNDDDSGIFTMNDLTDFVKEKL